MTARKIDRQREMREADFAGASAPADYQGAAIAWDRLQNRITPSLAAELGLSRQTCEDWGNPGRRKRGPHLLMAQAIELALELKPRAEQRADVFAPLDWLAARFDRMLIETPAPGARHANATPAERVRLIVALLVEFTEFVDAVDEPVEASEAKRLVARQQLQDVINLSLQLLELFVEPRPAPAAGGKR